MYNQDNVIRYAIEARDAHATEVGKALDAWIAEQTPDTKASLRIALVAMSLGHESSAHDGSTRSERIAAAQRALDAWDGLPGFGSGPAVQSGVATREQFVDSVGSLSNALAYETRTLSIGSEFLPPFARAVRAGGEPSSAYWAWLIESAETSREEAARYNLAQREADCDDDERSDAEGAL